MLTSQGRMALSQRTVAGPSTDANRVPRGWTGAAAAATMALPSFHPGRTGSEPTMSHLLLIDDDPDLVAEQVRHAFPGPRHRVEVASTGSAGLARARAEPPDVILLDLRLPDQSGLEVYQQLRQFDARIPVIFVTSAKAADAAIEAMKQGAYDYLFKPLDLNQFKNVVGAALEVS